MLTHDAIRLTECLLAWSVLLQTVEYWRLQSALKPGALWGWDLQREAFPGQATQQVLDGLFQPRAYAALLVLRAVAACALAIQGSSVLVVLMLFLSGVLTLLRWRGAFNGGSDFMTLIVNTGLLIAVISEGVGERDWGLKACLWYIALHAITSYFVSGWVKLLRSEWRSGEALTVFLDEAIYGPLRSTHPLRSERISALASWAFILWECAAPIVLVHPLAAMAYCAVAWVFHVLVFWYFGLNRFLWAWTATFPALVWAGSQGVVL